MHAVHDAWDRHTVMKAAGMVPHEGCFSNLTGMEEGKPVS